MKTLLASVLAAVVLLALAPAQSMALDPTQAHIDNGTIQLGVRDEGDLNAYDVDAPGDYFGLRYLPTGHDATSVRFGCEGWGVADAATETSGYADIGCDDGAVNAEVESFTVTDTTAVSTVLLRDGDANPFLRVTHDYHPSAASDNLYEVTVTIENLSGQTVEPRYRRVVDWTIEPNTFEEGVTIGGKSSPYLLATSNDGYSSANPLSPTFCTGGPCVNPYLHGPPGFFFNAAKTDQGSLFDLALPSLAPSASVKFHLFYGAAGSKTATASALADAGADVWALATPSEGPTTGIPNTFTLAFRLADLVPPPVVPPAPPPVRISPIPIIQFRPIKLPTIPLVSAASGPKKQDIDKLYVKVLINKAGKATVSGSVNVPGGASRVYKLKSVTKTLTANVKKKIRLKLSRKGLKAAKRALKRGKKLRAKITIKTTDSAGADTSRTKRTIRLKR